MVASDGSLECFNNSKVPRNDFMRRTDTGGYKDMRHDVMWLAVKPVESDVAPDYYTWNSKDGNAQQYFALSDSGEAIAGVQISTRCLTLLMSRWLHQSFFPHDFLMTFQNPQ